MLRHTIPLALLLNSFCLARSASMTPSSWPPQSDTASPGMRAARSGEFGRTGEGHPKLEDVPEEFGVIFVDGPAIAELPGDRAEVILIGTITGVQAFLSTFHTTIYTESTIQVEQVIDRTQTVGPAKPGASITLTQTGGAIQLANGRILRQTVSNRGEELKRNGRYAFFLVYLKGLDIYGCPKAWELAEGKAVAVAADDLGRVRAGKSTYHGMDEVSFIDALKQQKASWDPKHPH